ncbi:carbohydrate ABC transporter substrate-binding protein (CUT1 family) [Jatrophihabitans sp. GAS493]|uniref:ABC transporter substrate-binding protein n=1 Tax=Jatrophihabitans sp. GAS493 TaxID=1907575 RepID=UPI000BB67EC1|nr:extracellular solute-binding protein [Jatrophihabitans sp. GAS493]SOD72082.1 carbohydrate ABC transporter substrate-binding protein (CUT1 family) [Jatrophihabitans sp. GAS493]
MIRKTRVAAFVALGASVALLTTACTSSSGGSGSDSSSGASATLTLWTNATTGPGSQFFTETVKSFESAHPNVTIKIQIVQNEDLDGKLQTALQGGKSTAPDIFLQRGGGKLSAMVQANQVLDISDSISPDTKEAVSQGAFAAEQVDGKTYAMPVSVLPGGFWYSKDVFDHAGVTTPPTTLDSLNQAVTKLKASGVAPIALGGKDAWPAAHWYYWFALRECSQSVLNSTAKSLKFEDPCWTKAGNDLQAFAATKPYNDGFLNTSAQQGAGSSAGLIANHKAGAEVMGAWDPGVIGSLTPDQKALPDLGFFPFVQVPGGQGDPKAIMGGVDAYSCSAWAPKQACTDFLNYLDTPTVQEGYYKAFQAPPVNKTAQSVVTEPYLQAVIQAFNSAPYVSLWLDTLYGQNVGNALNTAVVNLLAGKGSAEDIIKSVDKASAKG